jgi:hypothetical protein
VTHAPDVGVVVADDPSDLAEHARPVVDPDAERDELVAVDQRPGQHVLEGRGVDVPATQQGNDRLLGRGLDGVGLECGDTRRRRSLDELFAPFQQPQRRRRDLRVRHRHHPVDVFGDDLVGEGSDVACGDPISDRVGVVVVDRVAGGETLRERRRTLRLDADDPRVGTTPPQRGRHAADQPAAPDRNDDRVELRHLVE